MSTMPLVVLLIGVMLITMLTRVFLPMGQKIEGLEIKKLSLPFQYRLLYHRTSIYLTGVIMVLGGLGGWLSFALQVVMVLGAFAIVGIRINYRFTTEGVALNNVVVRGWNEFSGYTIEGRYLKLKTAGKEHGFSILLPPQDRTEIERMVSKLVKTGAEQPAIAMVQKYKPTVASRPAKKPRRAG